MAVDEKGFQSDLLADLNKLGYAFKVSDRFHAGRSDIFFTSKLYGPWWIELKFSEPHAKKHTYGIYLTANQWRFLYSMNEHGSQAAWMLCIPWGRNETRAYYGRHKVDEINAFDCPYVVRPRGGNWPISDLFDDMERR